MRDHDSALGRLATGQATAIAFVCAALCIAGVYAALSLPSSVFPQTKFPRVARVDLVGGRAPEYHVVVEPVRLQAAGLSLQQLTDALTKNNLIAPTGMHEENHHLYLTVIDGRLRNAREIEDLPVTVVNGNPLRIKDVARVERGPE